MKARLSIAAAATLLSLAPALAQQADTPRGEPVTEGARASATAEEKGLIRQELQGRFRTYVVQQAPASYAYTSTVAVGAVLPETGVTYYDVPAEYGVTPYRYTVVNNTPVLVEPSSRRIVQIIR